jgi:hypothetical protein
MRAVAFLSALVAALALFPAVAAATPSPVAAWYVYGSSSAALASYAYTRGCEFAKSQPGGGLRMMLLDFGAARKLSAGTWGTVDFSNTTVSNADILAALEAAADGYHNCHVRGAVDIAYGNSNYHLSASGMSTTDAWYAGYHQAERSEDLFDYSVNASQWTVVRKWWNANRGGYFFAGATATTGAGLTPGAAWNTLSSLNSGLVDSELVCFGC